MIPDPKTIIIYRLGSIGDAVVSLPCLNRIVERFPNARRIALTNVPVSSVAAPLELILKDGGFIHDVLNYQIGERRLSELLALRKAIMALKADLFIYLTESPSLLATYRNLLFFRSCGLRHILGAPVTRDLTACRTDPQTGMLEREAERLARCLSGLGPIDPFDPAAWSLRLTKTEQQTADAFLAPMAGRPFLAVNTGGKVRKNDWGMDNWTALIQALSSILPNGATLGRNVRIRPSARITYPWKVKLGHHVWVGDYAELYSLGPIEIGDNSVVSQKSYLCAATHDHQKPDFPIYEAAICIGPSV